MSSIIRSTTPTIKYKFKEIDVSDIVVAYLTMEQHRRVVLEKDITSATIETEDNTIQWRLTQEETFSLAVGKIAIMLNWRTASGIRGASNKDIIAIEPNLKAEVI